MRVARRLSISSALLGALSGCTMGETIEDVASVQDAQAMHAAPSAWSAHGTHHVTQPPVSAQPAWILGPSMATARYEHTMTALLDGRILVTGGFVSGSTTTNTAEIYDPATMTWTAAPNMLAARARHSAVILPNSNGRVLVTGGFPGGDGTQTTEIYDPATNTWTPAANMGTLRMYQPSLALPNGKILVASGCCNAAYGTAEVYDWQTNTWAPTPGLAILHAGPTLTFLPTTNKSLLIGNSNIPTTELYDHATNTWATTGNLNFPRNVHSENWLPILGKVVVAGGISQATPTKTTELYTPATGVWTVGAMMTFERYSHTGTVLTENGVEDIVWAGGTPVANGCERFSGQACPNLNVGRTLHRALAVPHQGKIKVMVTGGLSGVASTTSVEFLDLNPLASNGASCTLANQCVSGFCADGVCCDTACNAGVCDACSVASGADTNGTCKALTGPVCDDGNACTMSDACNAGVCMGGSPVVCSALNDCHDVGTCDPQSGMCSNPELPEGTSCEGGTCQNGACQIGGGVGGMGGMGGMGGSGGNGDTGGMGGMGGGMGGMGGKSETGGMGGMGGKSETGGMGGQGEGGGDGAGAGRPNDPRDEGGCACSLPGSTSTNAAGWLTLLGLVLMRSRRDRSPSGRRG